MPFDEFLSRRLAELLRFAVVLTGDPVRAAEVVGRVVVLAFPCWPRILAAGRPFAVVRTGVVRAFVASPVADTSCTPVDGDDPEVRRRRSWSAVVLAVFGGQSIEEVAAALDTSVETARSDVLVHRTPGGSAVATEEHERLLDEFDRLADEAAVDDVRVADEIVARLEALPADTPDAVFERLFVTSAQIDAGPAAAPSTGTDTSEPGSEVARRTGSYLWGEVIEQPPRAESEEPGHRPTRYAARTIAAALIVTVGVVVAVLVSHDRGRSDSDKASRTAAPATSPSASPTSRGGAAQAVGHALPGTRIVRRSYGSGSTVIDTVGYRLAPGRQLAVSATCSGPGAASVGPLQIAQCDGQPVGAAVTVDQMRSLRVTADPTTTWRLTVVDQPDPATNGSLQYPVSSLLDSTSPVDRVGAASGSGTRSVPLTPGTTTARVEDVRLILTCSGDGVAFASSDHRFDGDHTATCFAGWSYEFDVPGALLPGALTVRAAPTTSWRLIVVRA